VSRQGDAVIAAIYTALIEAGKPLTRDEICKWVKEHPDPGIYNSYAETEYWIRMLEATRGLIRKDGFELPSAPLFKWASAPSGFVSRYEIGNPLDALGAI
jgi:hypothetical protein